VTEADWLASTDPVPMLVYLRGRPSDRKLRLFAVACCRRIWHLLTDPRSRRAVEVVEDYADGTVGDDELRLAVIGADSVAEGRVASATEVADLALATAALAALNATARDAMRAADYAAANAAAATFHAATAAQAASAAAVRAVERRGQAELLVEVFGNPFRHPSVAPELFAWSDGMLPRLAQTIYEEKSFERMPILADALEDASCDNLDLIDHCRREDEHIRGCWAVDLLLGKE
jgi:hypothetical protein